MSWTFRSIGSLATGINVNLTPGAPAGFQAGDLLLVSTGEFAGSDTPPDTTLTSFGFTRVSSNNTAMQCALYGKIALGGDTMPTFSWGNEPEYAYCLAYTGAPSSLTGIVNQANDRQNSTVQNLVNPSLTLPTQPGCLVILLTQRNKTSASDAATISNYGSFTQRGSFVAPGNFRYLFTVEDWIQTTATSLAAGNQVTSIADGSAQTTESQIIALNPGVLTAVPYPPLNNGGMIVQVCQ